jgi:hypothetical protein
VRLSSEVAEPRSSDDCLVTMLGMITITMPTLDTYQDDGIRTM